MAENKTEKATPKKRQEARKKGQVARSQDINGAVVMLAGIGFLAVITASVTASLIESSRRRFAARSEVDATRRMEEISERLARIEAALAPPAPPSAR